MATDFQDTSVDCAICLEPLENGSKVLTLPCGHRWHYDCLVQQLQTAGAMTSSRQRLMFTGCQCAKCGQICEHSELEHLTRATDALRKRVDVLLEEQLRLDAPNVWRQAVANGENTAKDALIKEARRKYAFYLCSHCKEPYFGGTIECADEIGLDDTTSTAPEQRLCTACAPQSQIVCQNPLEHGQFLVWKCRYCCQPSTHVCYGNVHFCDDCHDRNSRRHREIQRQQYQRGIRRSNEVKPPPLEPIPCLGESCCYPKPNNRRHHCNGPSPTDCEQVYSCVFCDSNASRGHMNPTEPGSHNLITNPSGQDGLRGWQQLNRRMSWVVEQSELPVNVNTPTNFVSSFQDCIMIQRVDLSAILQATNRTEPIRFEVSARYMGRTDCPSLFQMQAMIGWSKRGGNMITHIRPIVDRRETDVLEAPPDYWERACLELQLDPSRLRAAPPSPGSSLGLYVIVMGKDRRFWQGTFGSKVAEISVRVLGSPEELEATLSPVALEQSRQQEQDRRNRTLGQQRSPRQHARNLRGLGPMDGNSTSNGGNQNTTRRMFWDLLVPVIGFLLFVWLAMNGEPATNTGRSTYKTNV